HHLHLLIKSFCCVSVLIFASCSSTQSGVSEGTKEVPPRDPAKERSETVEDEKQAMNYRLSISFISIGEGPDYNAKQSFDQLLLEWEKKTGKKIDFEQHPWGREGELDLCSQLVELAPDQQTDFISKIKETIGTSKLVQISENQPCTHKR
ncbi:MAG: hypothetical protein ACKOYC_08415, partial [Bacteroidota bacterium]